VIVRRLLLIALLLAPAILYAQRERQLTPPADESRYGRRFFLQLRAIFGRFRESDLQRAFEGAQPIQCSELINGDGEWRTVAFFNERRELGDWYRSNFDEVKSDLAVFTFKGACRGPRGPVQLATKFPVTESLDAYSDRKIEFNYITVNVNAPVSASFDSQSQAYSFDLPYLFLVSQEGNSSIYSLEAPRLADKYAPEVMDHWDCKSVRSDTVTYHFLICRTTTVGRGRAPRGMTAPPPAFGASAFFILSDGREASSSVTLSFNDAEDTKRTVPDVSAPTIAAEPEPPQTWQLPDSDERIAHFQREEFRLRFPEDRWSGKIASAQVLSGARMTSLTASNTAADAEYCVWFPGAANAADLLASDPDKTIQYAMSIHDQDRQSPTSITLELRSPAGVQIGSLKCVFPRIPAAGGITFSRWTAIVGDHLLFEVRP
jgi:hypothetical protein